MATYGLATYGLSKYGLATYGSPSVLWLGRLWLRCNRRHSAHNGTAIHDARHIASMHSAFACAHRINKRMHARMRKRTYMHIRNHIRGSFGPSGQLVARRLRTVQQRKSDATERVPRGAVIFRLLAKAR